MKTNQKIQLKYKLDDEHLGRCPLLNTKEETANKTRHSIIGVEMESALFDFSENDFSDEKEVEINQDIVKKSRRLQVFTRFSVQRSKIFLSFSPFQQFAYQVTLWRIFCQMKS